MLKVGSQTVLSFATAKQIVSFNSFRLCRKDEILFDIVAKTGNIDVETGNIVAKNGNNVDFVEIIVRLVAFDNGASTLLLV